MDDGAEVNVHNTLNPDTDGGGASDHTEVRFGSDPHNPDDEPVFSADQCPAETFSCGIASLCIQEPLRCDGYWECPNGADEDDCAECSGGAVLCSAPGPAYQEGGFDWVLGGPLCLRPEGRCNSSPECRDGEDEIGCECAPDEFSCGAEGPCFHMAFVGDGECDCPNCADE